MMKIVVTGTSCSGFSEAVLLAQHHEVVAFNIISEKVMLINQRKSAIKTQRHPAQTDGQSTSVKSGLGA